MSLRVLIAAAAAAAALMAAGADATTPAQKDRQVIRFFQKHPQLAHTAAGERALWRILGHITDRQLETANVTSWAQATTLVGRYFGGAFKQWERACSASEGGWGRWVPNRYGSGAGGWLQFLSGTFYGVIDRAIAGARARGMAVPDTARSWYSPLGQALAGVQMLKDGRSNEWTGSGC